MSSEKTPKYRQKIKTLTKEELEEAVESTTMFIECLTKMGFSTSGSNRACLKKMTKELNIDTTHFTYLKKSADYSKENLLPIVHDSTSHTECIIKLGLPPKYETRTLKSHIQEYGLSTAHFMISVQKIVYTKELLEPIVAGSTNFSECLIKLGLHRSNQERIKKAVQDFELDITHFRLGKADYSKEIFSNIVTESYSYAECLEKLGFSLSGEGMNLSTIKKYIEEYSLDVSHFKRPNIIYSFEDTKTPIIRKKFLLKERGHQCERCKRKTHLKYIIPLDMHHIDKNSDNNVASNLILLCPTCHRLVHQIDRNIAKKS